MSLERLTKARRKHVGSKQTLKAIDRDQARAVYVAKNAERHILDPIIRACTARGVPLVYAENMQVLGKACGIEVGCAAAAIIEE
jgi:large subunit ribosomal protein L7A